MMAAAVFSESSIISSKAFCLFNVPLWGCIWTYIGSYGKSRINAGPYHERLGLWTLSCHLIWGGWLFWGLAGKIYNSCERSYIDHKNIITWGTAADRWKRLLIDLNSIFLIPLCRFSRCCFHRWNYISGLEDCLSAHQCHIHCSGQRQFRQC